MEYMTRRLIARQSMRYDGRNLENGEQFEATEVDAKYLTRTGRADPAPSRVASPTIPRTGRVSSRAPAPAPAPVGDNGDSTGTAGDGGTTPQE